MSRSLRRSLFALAVTALALGSSGCFNPFDPRIAVGVGRSEAKPEPRSATGVIELFRWCYQNRAINEYRELFTSDYVFTFATRDSAGNSYRGTPWRRDDELISAQNLFVTGKADEEPASSITLDFGNTLRAFAVSGRDPLYHREVSVGVVLTVRRPSSNLEVQGVANFFVVRGDVAKIPSDTGLQPDPNRWYIEGWEDNTIQNAPMARLLPAPGADRVTVATAAARSAVPLAFDPTPFHLTFGALKVVYR